MVLLCSISLKIWWQKNLFLDEHSSTTWMVLFIPNDIHKRKLLFQILFFYSRMPSSIPIWRWKWERKNDVKKQNELLPQGAVVVVQSVPYASIYILECTMRLSKHYETCNKVVQGLPGPTTKRTTTIGPPPRLHSCSIRKKKASR